MNYAEFVATVQRNLSFNADPGFIYAAIKEDLGIEKPMSAEYSGGQVYRAVEAAILRRYRRKEGEAEIRLFPSLAVQGKWFRASSYRLKGGWIEGGRKVEEYDLREVIEDAFNALVDLGTNVRMRQVGDGPIELAPEEREKYLDFCSRFGLLGLGFRRVEKVILYPSSEEARIEVETAGIRRDCGEHFGEYLRAPAHDFKSLYANYREPAFDFAMAATGFSLTARRIARIIEDPFGPRELEEAFTHARPRISMEGGSLSVAWAPNSLIDALYLHLFKVTVEGKYRYCANPECGKRFPRDGKRKYCSQECRWRFNKAMQRRA